MTKKIIKVTFMTIIFILTLFSYSFSESESDSINLIDEFQYKLGDCGVDENGVPLWIVNKENDWAEFKGIKELSEEISDEDTVWLRVKLPNLEYKNSGIYFEHLYANNFEIYLEDEKIYDKKREWIYNHNALIFPLQGTDSGNYMYVKVNLVDKKIGPRGNVLVDDYKTLQNMFLTKDLFNIYFGFGLIFISIIIFICSILLKKESKRIGLSLTFIILSIGIILIIASSNFLAYFPHFERLFLIFYDISLFSFLPLLTYFFHLVIVNGEKFKLFIRRLCQIQSIYSIFCVAIMFMNIITGYRLNTLYSFISMTLIGILFITQLITLVCTGIYYTIKGNINARIFILGFSIFATSLLTELIIYFSVHRNYGFSIWIWGLLALTISLIVIFVRQYLKNQEKLYEYSSELDRIDKIARTDHLTNLPNRMDLNNRIKLAINNYKFNNIDFFLVLCDIDNFKKINDTYGHMFGDEILVMFAGILKNTLGETHTVGRWGGEEFLLLVTTQDYQEVFNTIENTRQAISSHKFIINNKIIHITATFGICRYDDSQGINKCLEYIDQALYTGKKTGKNKIVVYEEISTIAIENKTININ